MLPCAVIIAYPFRNSRGSRPCIQPCKQERAWAATGMHCLGKSRKPGSRTPYQTPEYPRGGRSGTQTRSTQTCCPDLFTARPSPPYCTSSLSLFFAFFILFYRSLNELHKYLQQIVKIFSEVVMLQESDVGIWLRIYDWRTRAVELWG
jgi:hypothetical protein